MSVYSITQIKSEAIAAAQNPQYKTVNDACPYPFADEAGQLFKKYFESERTWLERQKDVPAHEIALQNRAAADIHRAIQAQHTTDWSAA